MKTYLYRASLPSIIIIYNIYNNYHNHLFQMGFSEYTEANTMSLIPLVTTFPEIRAFIIDFSFTVWTNMRPLLVH